jgi:hypothetical protein
MTTGDTSQASAQRVAQLLCKKSEINTLCLVLEADATRESKAIGLIVSQLQEQLVEKAGFRDTVSRESLSSDRTFCAHALRMETTHPVTQTRYPVITRNYGCPLEESPRSPDDHGPSVVCDLPEQRQTPDCVPRIMQNKNQFVM